VRAHIAAALLITLLAWPAAANVITTENARPGTNEWNVRVRALHGEIEGYASLTSVAPGETIRFYVNSVDPDYTIEVFRMGWYGGLGGRRMTKPVRRTTVKQPMPKPESGTGLIECRWTDPHSLKIPSDWVSGVYLAKLTALPSRIGSWIIFVVRSQPSRTARFIVQTSVTTYQAYNNWGGKSLYEFNSSGGRAYKVSFNRPYARKSGAADFLLGYEYPMVRFFEREGYDVTYTTDIDTHQRGAELLRYAAFLDIGHDEYWSWEMREAVEQARDSGVHLAFFSANDCYWQIRFEPSPVDGERDRVIAAWKESARQLDPVLRDDDPSNDRLATTLWRELPVSRPEDALIGTMYTYSPIRTDMVIGDTSHWIFEGTGLKSGDRLKGLLGYEVDRMTATAYAGTVALTRTEFAHRDGQKDESNMTLYTARSGALVFATGSMYWGFGVDDYNVQLRPEAPANKAVQQMTRNVIARMTMVTVSKSGGGTGALACPGERTGILTSGARPERQARAPVPPLER